MPGPARLQSLLCGQPASGALAGHGSFPPGPGYGRMLPRRSTPGGLPCEEEACGGGRHRARGRDECDAGVDQGCDDPAPSRLPTIHQASCCRDRWLPQAPPTPTPLREPRRTLRACPTTPETTLYSQSPTYRMNRTLRAAIRGYLVGTALAGFPLASVIISGAITTLAIGVVFVVARRHRGGRRSARARPTALT